MTKPTQWVCAQQRLRSAWASTKTDQSSMSAWRNLGSLATHWAHSEDSDQTGRTLILLDLSCRGLFNRYSSIAEIQGTTNLCIILWTEIMSLYYFCNTPGANYCINFLLLHIKCQQLHYMSPVKRICVFEHSVMKNFHCACPAIQKGQGSGFLSEGSSRLTACMSEQRRFWRDCADAQARLNLRYSHRR